jgi:tetratricopeptide (TPR) repeat protein
LAILACCALSLSAAARDPWLRIKSPNFEIFTTAGERSGRDLARHFERVRAFFVQAFGAAPTDARPVRVIAFRNEREYQPYRPSEAAAAFYLTGPVRDYIVMSGAGGEFYEAAVHEYVHLLIQQGQSKVPLWVNEGMFELYSTVDSTGGQMVVGKAPERCADVLSSGQWIDLAALFDVGPKSPLYNEKTRAGMFYSESWVLTHMLLLDSRYRANHKALMDAFAAGADAAAAFQAAYGKSVAEVQKDLRGYVASDRLTVAVFNLQWAKANDALDISEASPQAGLALADMTSETAGRVSHALEAYNQLSRDYPSSWEVEGGWAAALARLGESADAMPHFARAIELGCRDAATFIAYSQALMAARRNGEAVSVMRTAVNLDPTPGPAHRQLGMALTAAGSYPEALVEFAKAGSFDAKLLSHFGIGRVDGAKRAHQLFDFPLVQQALLVNLHPGFLAALVTGVQFAGDLPEVLARVIEIDNLNRAGEMLLGEVPDPLGPVAHHHLCFGATPAAPPSFQIEPGAKVFGCLDG